MSTQPLTSWQPSLYPKDGPGRFYNTFRQILALKPGDSANLANVVKGANSIKSALVWRTKDGWEIRVTTYSGSYGVSLDVGDLKANTALFDDLLTALDVDPPFLSEQKCKCTCGSPSKGDYLPGHEIRLKLLTGEISTLEVPSVEAPPMADQADAPELDTVEAPEPELAVSEPEGEIPESSDTEEAVPDATPTPEPAPIESQTPKRDEYGEWFNQQVVSPPKSPPKARQSANDQLLTQYDVYASLDGMLDPSAYSPKGDDISVHVDMLGIRDGFVSVVPFVGEETCNCGCGSPSGKRRYLSGHDLRHRVWLVDKARLGDRRAYATLRGYGWLKYLYATSQIPTSTSVDHAYSPARVPAGLPISSEVFADYEMLDPGPGSREQKIKRLTTRRDAARGAVARSLLNEALYRMRGGYDRAMPIKPSHDRAKVADLAFRLAAADVGVFEDGENIAWSQFDDDVRQQIQTHWKTRKAELMSDAETLMDYADLEEPLVVTAGRLRAAILRRAVQAGLVGPIPYEMAVRFSNSNPLFDPEKAKSGDDDERYSPVQEIAYEKYRGNLEFSGQEFNPMAKFYNYLAMEISEGRKPDWVTGDGNPWDLARDAIERWRFSNVIVPYWSEWWLKYGYEAAAYSPTHMFRVLAKNARDYMLTKRIGSQAVSVGDGGLHDLTLEPQSLDNITDRGRAVFVENSPFKDGFFMMFFKSNVFMGWGEVHPSDKKRVSKVFVDAEALEGTNIPMGGNSSIKWDADQGFITFNNLSPRMAVRWLGDNFGATLERAVPYNHFYLGDGKDGYPTILQDAYLDGSAFAQLNDWGVVHKVPGGAKALLEIAQSGSILSAWDRRRLGKAYSDSAKRDAKHGLDKLVYAGFSNSGGKDFLPRAENLFVMKSEIAFGKNLVFAGQDFAMRGDRRAKYDSYMRGWGGAFGESLPVDQIASPRRTAAFRGNAAEINVPHELRLEDVVALIVPDSYIDDSDAADAIKLIRKKNPKIEIFYLDGDDTDRRAKAREVVVEYNRSHGLAPWNLERGGSTVSVGDLVVASGDEAKSDMAWYNVYPMEITRVNGTRIYGRLRSTSTTRKWLERDDSPENRESANVWLASAVRSGVIDRDRKIQEVMIDPNHIVWLSPRLESR